MQRQFKLYAGKSGSGKKSAEDKAKEPKYDDFTDWIGQWEVIVYRLTDYSIDSDMEHILKTRSKVYLTRRFLTKMMFD